MGIERVPARSPFMVADASARSVPNGCGPSSASSSWLLHNGTKTNDMVAFSTLTHPWCVCRAMTSPSAMAQHVSLANSLEQGTVLGQEHLHRPSPLRSAPSCVTSYMYRIMICSF